MIIIKIIVGMLLIVVGALLYAIGKKFLGAYMKNLIEERKKQDFCQSFSEYVKQYILDVDTNELQELPTPKNIQNYIDSFIDTALERALERFLPQNLIVDQRNDELRYRDTMIDLALMADAFDTAEEYREQFGLPADMSIGDIYAHVGKHADELKEKILKKQEEMNNNGKTQKAEQEIQ